TLRRAATLAPPARRARGRADDFREALIGLMRRQHVVIGGDDAEIGLGVAGERYLVGHAAGGEAMGEVAAGEAAPPCPPVLRRFDSIEVAEAAVLASADDAVRHF